jgi:hypothetical protein
MKGSAASQPISRSVNCHRRCNILGVILLIIYKKACITLNWFIWERLLGLLFFIIWRMFRMRAWCSIRLLLFVLFRYLFLLAYHVFLRLAIRCCNISHFLTYNGFLKMMIDYILFRLLFNVVERLMHPTQLIVGLCGLYLFSWEEFLLSDIIQHHRIHRLILVGSCLCSDTVIISCVILMAAI